MNIVKQLWETEKPTALTKTMTRTQLYQTRTQLYQANNPLWAYEYSLNQIDIFANKNTDNNEVLDRCFEVADRYR